MKNVLNILNTEELSDLREILLTARDRTIKTHEKKKLDLVIEKISFEIEFKNLQK